MTTIQSISQFISRILILFIALFLVWSYSAMANDSQLTSTLIKPDLRFSHFTLRNGLPTEQLLTIEEDAQGFLWLGAENGLMRYDGYEFRTYQYGMSDELSSFSNHINALYNDSKDRLWVGTWGSGLYYYHAKHDYFIKIPLDNSYEGYDPSLYIAKIVEDNDGHLLIPTVDGVYQLDDDLLSAVAASSQQKLQYTDISDSITKPVKGDYIRAVAVSEDKQTMWITSQKKVIAVNRSDNSQKTIAQFSKLVKNLYYDAATQRLWIGTLAGLYYYDLNTQSLSESVIDSSVVSRIKPYNDNELLVSSPEGLHIVNQDTLQFYLYTSDDSDPYSLLSNVVSDFLIDYTGTLWVVNSGAGLNKHIPTHQGIKHLPRIANGDVDVLSNKILAYANTEKTSDIWLGTIEGLARYNTMTGLSVQMNPTEMVNCQGESLQNINKIVKQKNTGLLWLAAGSTGIASYDPQLQRVVCFPVSVLNVKTAVNTILFDRDNKTLWAGTSNGLMRFNTENGELIHIHDLINSTRVLGFGSVFSLHFDQSNQLWVGGNVILITINAQQDSFTQWVGKEGQPKLGLSSSEIVNTIIEDKNNTIWLGSENGLIALDLVNNRHQRLMQSNSVLIDNSIKAVITDNKGSFWLSMQKGLAEFDPLDQQFLKQLTIADGLVANAFVRGSAFQSPDGDLYFGDEQGATIINPNQITARSVLPKINLIDVLLVNKALKTQIIDDQSPLLTAASQLQSLTLTYAQGQMLGFSFAATHLLAPGLNQYRYQLINFDAMEVSASSSQRIATYTNLPPGDYSFVVNASNDQNQWSDSPLEISLTILPPWYRTWWAYVSYILLIIGSIYALIYYREQASRNYQRTLELKVQEKTETLVEKNNEIQQLLTNKEQLLIAKNQLFHHLSHEFRTPLTLILGHTNLLKANDKTEQKSHQLIQTNAHRLDRMLGQLLSLARINEPESLLKHKTYRLDEQIQYITTCFEPLIEEKKLKLTADPVSPIVVSCIEDTLEKALSNLMSNAIKYTPNGGSIDVTVKEINDKIIKVMISDTGIGIKESDQASIFDDFYRVQTDSQLSIDGIGLGLALTKTLIEASGGELFVDSIFGQGSCFSFTLLKANEIDIDDVAPVAHLQTHIIQQEVSAVKIAEPVTVKPNNMASDDLNDNRKRVLIVDDHMDMLDLIEVTLGKQYWYQRASNAYQGLAMAQEEIPNFIISDVMMPGEDGFWLCDQLKKDPRTSHIPVILLTARADMDSRLEGLSKQANDYITKPFNDQELQLKVENLLELSSRIKQKIQSELNKDDSSLYIEQEFLNKLDHIIYQNTQSAKFKVSDLANKLHMSERQLHRKLEAIADFTAKERIRDLRLQTVKDYLEQGLTTTQILDKIEYSSENYLSTLFKKRYGQTPKQYQKEYQTKNKDHS